MFKTPVSTIRDVAELTEASPNLIARILGEMRGTGEYENLVGYVSSQDVRISQTEAEIAAFKADRRASLNREDPWSTPQGFIFSLAIVLGLLAFIAYWFFQRP